MLARKQGIDDAFLLLCRELVAGNDIRVGGKPRPPDVRLRVVEDYLSRSVCD
jgi:hypothetical protein